VLLQVSQCRLVGVNGKAAHSMAWLSGRGQVAYPVANLLVLEDLQSHRQTFLEHHTQQVGGGTGWPVHGGRLRAEVLLTVPRR
jgi:hypothetical protein